MRPNDTFFNLIFFTNPGTPGNRITFVLTPQNVPCGFLDTFCPPSSISRFAKIRGRGNVKYIVA